MHSPFTIAYITGRWEPKIEWFAESLELQCEAESAQVIIIDYHKGKRPLKFPRPERVIAHVTPKPTVWQGPGRLTRNEYFAAANARNTAICLVPTSIWDDPSKRYVVFVDDVSVLLPGWAACVQQAIRENYIALGAYKKVKNLQVHSGAITHFEEHAAGIDSRLRFANGDQTPCGGSWLFGCSFAAPLQALLDVNGLDENCDSTGLGSEDYCLGIRIGNTKKYPFRYDRRMMTYESEEAHAPGPNDVAFLRKDKGVSPHDKSHAIMNAAMGSASAPNYFGPGGIALLRQHVLRTGEFPVAPVPQHDWFDGQPLSEL